MSETKEKKQKKNGKGEKSQKNGYRWKGWLSKGRAVIMGRRKSAEKPKRILANPISTGILVKLAVIALLEAG